MIFIDTGAFVARYLKRDQHYQAAHSAWHELLESGEPCFTSNLVLCETPTILARRTTCEFAAARARHIYSSSFLHILRPEANNEITAIQLLEKYADQRIGFCDCVSFALMRRLGISNALTFDNHFRIPGFETFPINISA